MKKLILLALIIVATATMATASGWDEGEPDVYEQPQKAEKSAGQRPPSRGNDLQIISLESEHNHAFIDRVICRLFGGKNSDFSTAKKALGGYVVPDVGNKSRREARKYPAEFKNNPPPTKSADDPFNHGRLLKIVVDGKTAGFTMSLGTHTWSVDSNAVYSAIAAARLELGLFPQMREWNITNWDYKQTVLNAYKHEVSESIYLPDIPFRWKRDARRAVFSGVSGEFTIEPNGIFTVAKSAIDSQISTEQQKRGLKATANVGQTEIVIACLARKLDAGRDKITPESVAVTLDYLRDMQLDPEYSGMLPTVINFCLAGG